jgi:hypothetical protein
MHYFLTYTAVFNTTNDSLHICTKWGTNGIDYEHYCLLVCDDMYSNSQQCYTETCYHHLQGRRVIEAAYFSMLVTSHQSTWQHILKWQKYSLACSKAWKYILRNTLETYAFMHVHMYVCMLCMYVHMYVMYVYMYVCMYICIYMYVGMYICMPVRNGSYELHDNSIQY